MLTWSGAGTHAYLHEKLPVQPHNEAPQLFGLRLRALSGLLCFALLASLLFPLSTCCEIGLCEPRRGPTGEQHQILWWCWGEGGRPRVSQCSMGGEGKGFSPTASVVSRSLTAKGPHGGRPLGLDAPPPPLTVGQRGGGVQEGQFGGGGGAGGICLQGHALVHHRLS